MWPKVFACFGRLIFESNKKDIFHHNSIEISTRCEIHQLFRDGFSCTRETERNSIKRAPTASVFMIASANAYRANSKIRKIREQKTNARGAWRRMKNIGRFGNQIKP